MSKPYIIRDGLPRVRKWENGQLRLGILGNLLVASFWDKWAWGLDCGGG